MVAIPARVVMLVLAPVFYVEPGGGGGLNA